MFKIKQGRRSEAVQARSVRSITRVVAARVVNAVLSLGDAVPSTTPDPPSLDEPTRHDTEGRLDAPIDDAQLPRTRGDEPVEQGTLNAGLTTQQVPLSVISIQTQSD